MGRSGNSKQARWKVKDPGEEMDTLNAYMHAWVKRLIPPGTLIGREIEEYIITRYGTHLRQVDEIDRAIERKENEIKKLDSDIKGLEHKRLELVHEEERIKRAMDEMEIKSKYARFVVFRQLLVGSVLGKSGAIKAAFGVDVQERIGHWSILLRKQHFPYSSDYDNPELNDKFKLEPFVEDLIRRFFEIAPGVSYVGRGAQEEKEYQNYMDVVSGSLRLCGVGHLYDALKNECPSCKDLKRGVYVVMENGLPVAVLSPDTINKQLASLKRQKEEEDLPARMARHKIENEAARQKRITAAGGEK